MKKATEKKASPLLDYIKRAGLNQYEFAKQARVTPATLSRYISGVSTPRRRIALRISALTGIPVQYLLYSKKELEKHQ